MENNKNLRQVTFNLKDEAVMKSVGLVKGNLVCYAFNGEDEESSDNPGNYLKVFSKDNNTVYLNGTEIGTLAEDELLAHYVRDLFQQHLKDKTFKEAVAFIRGGESNETIFKQ